MIIRYIFWIYANILYTYFSIPFALQFHSLPAVRPPDLAQHISASFNVFALVHKRESDDCIALFVLNVINANNVEECPRIDMSTRTGCPRLRRTSMSEWAGMLLTAKLT